MNELGRPQAAIASLEHATRVVDSKESSGIVKTITDNLRGISALGLVERD